jgi:hypothetical protein
MSRVRQTLDFNDPLGVADVILPTQFSDLVGRHGLSNEQRLMLAVLVDAINILRNWRGFAGAQKRRWFAEAGRWVFARGTTHPFSFDNVCDALGINSQTLRQRLAPLAIGSTSNSSIGLGRLRLKEASRAQHMTINRVRRRAQRHQRSRGRVVG